MRKVTCALLLALIPVVIFIAWLTGSSSFFPNAPADRRPSTVSIDDVTIEVEVADTEALRQRGLSGRTALQADTGLLFVFYELNSHGIWMKDMSFPIDIVWIASASDDSSSGAGKTARVVDLKRDVRPSSFPEIFVPRATADYVLEVNAGFTAAHNIKVGGPVLIVLEDTNFLRTLDPGR